MEERGVRRCVAARMGHSAATSGQDVARGHAASSGRGVSIFAARRANGVDRGCAGIESTDRSVRFNRECERIECTDCSVRFNRGCERIESTDWLHAPKRRYVPGSNWMLMNEQPLGTFPSGRSLINTGSDLAHGAHAPRGAIRALSACIRGQRRSALCIHGSIAVRPSHARSRARCSSISVASRSIGSARLGRR